MLPLVGDGLLPADIDGKQKPKTDAPIPIVGTQDDGARLRRDLRRAEHLGPDGQVELDAHRVARPEHAAAGGGVRLDLPVRADVARLPAAAGHHRTRRSTSTSCPTGSGRPGGSPTATSRTTNRWSRTSRSRRRPASPACAGTRSGGTGGRLLALPAGHLRAGRRRPPLDGQHRPGQEGQHGARLQRRQRHRRLPGHPLHGPPRRRPARADDPRRRHDHQRHRRPDDDELALGRLHRR